MKAVIALLFIVALSQAKSLRHEWWYDLKNGITDYLWNFCDYKCLYLENYAQGKDFVVVELEDTKDFWQCYVKQGSGYKLWSTVVQNKWFDEHCGKGKDDKEVDYINDKNKEVNEVKGVGLNKEWEPYY